MLDIIAHNIFQTLSGAWLGLNIAGSIAVGLLTLLSLYLLSRFYGVEVRRIVGRTERPRSSSALVSIGRLLITVLLLFAFSIGALSLVVWTLSYVAPSFAESLLSSSEETPVESRSLKVWLNVAAFINFVILTPIYEEFIFRGLLVHRWTKKWGLMKAVVVSSLIFGVLHIDIIGAFVFGYVMCLLYLRTKTLFVPIAAHALNNLFAWSAEVFSSNDSAELSITQLQAEWPLFVVCLALSVPWLSLYVRRNRVSKVNVLPYEANDGTN